MRGAHAGRGAGRWPGLGKSPRPGTAPSPPRRASPDTRRQPPSQLRRPRAMAGGEPRGRWGRQAARTPPRPFRATTHPRPSPRPLPGPAGAGLTGTPPSRDCPAPFPGLGPAGCAQRPPPRAGQGRAGGRGLARLCREWETSGVKQSENRRAAPRDACSERRCHLAVDGRWRGSWHLPPRPPGSSGEARPQSPARTPADLKALHGQIQRPLSPQGQTGLKPTSFIGQGLVSLTRLPGKV